ncbi:MAG: hypothetical protein WC584_01510 [Candidatus Pacearchaeota archaeon]
MVIPSTAGNVAEGVVSVLSPEIAKQLVILVQAIGGLFILYLIFLGVRLYFNYKNMKNTKKMKEDIELIKKRLKVK